MLPSRGRPGAPRRGLRSPRPPSRSRPRRLATPTRSWPDPKEGKGSRSLPDQMTSRERIFAALTMSALPDQVPVVPLLMTRGIREGGITVDVALRDGEAQAHAKMKAVDKFGGDVQIVGTDLFTPVECVEG